MMAKYSNKNSSSAPRGNVVDLAALLGLTPQRVYDLLAKNIVRKEPDGEFNLTTAIREYYIFKLSTKERVDYNVEKALNERIKRQMGEMDLAEKRHEMHAAADVELVMVDMLTNLRTQLLGIADKMAPQLEGKSREEIANMLTSEIETRLTELSNYEPTMFDIEQEANDEAEDD